MNDEQVQWISINSFSICKDDDTKYIRRELKLRCLVQAQRNERSE